jgi:glycyl-tRNA synthetase alpha subunit
MPFIRENDLFFHHYQPSSSSSDAGKQIANVFNLIDASGLGLYIINHFKYIREINKITRKLNSLYTQKLKLYVTEKQEKKI